MDISTTPSLGRQQITDGQLRRFGRSAEAVKVQVRIEQVAQEYFEARLSGPNRLLARCPSPEHEDRTPSFTLFLDTGRFRCFGIGCGLTGDVVDLEKLCGGHDQLWTALVALATRYGVELTTHRSAKWHEWQNEKARRRKLLRSAIATTYQRRYFRLFSDYIEAIEDHDEREDGPVNR